MSAHAKLSASGSKRWMSCPGSIKAEDGMPDGSSVHAMYGTAAHELAEMCLTKGHDADRYAGKTLPESKHVVDHEMIVNTQSYVDYVRAVGGHQLYEVRVDFSPWVPDGFGTSDAIVYDDEGVLHIIDLKFGKGVRVFAEENTQAQLYALGVVNDFGPLFEVDKIRVTIVQPRLDHVDSWDTTYDDLMVFGDRASAAADLALSDNPPRNPSEDACQFCRAKATCPSLYQHTSSVLMADFDDLADGGNLGLLDRLTDAQLQTALKSKKMILSWLDAIEELIKQRIDDGDTATGFKMVAGRSTRSWRNDLDEQEIEESLLRAIGEAAFVRKMVSPAQAEKLLGKKGAHTIEGLWQKSTGAPTLVQDSDPRPALDASRAAACASEFDMLNSQS